MSDLQLIQNKLEAISRRIRLFKGWQALWNGLLLASIVYLVTLAVYKFLPVSSTVLVWGFGSGTALMIFSFVFGLRRTRSLPEVARWVDIQGNLKERLSTALDLQKDSVQTPWSELVLKDAAEQARRLDTHRLVGFHVPRISRVILVLLAAAFSLGFIKEYRTPAQLQAKVDKENIKETGKQIASFVKRSLDQHPKLDQESKEALLNAEDLGLKLANLSPGKSEALKGLENASKKLEDQLKKMDQTAAVKQLQKAAQEHGAKDASQNQTQQGSKEQSAQNGSQGANVDSKKMEEMQKQMADLKQQMAKMGEKTGPEADAAKESVKNALSNLSKQSAEMGQQVKGLDEAIAALQANQTDLFIKNMDVAVQDMEKMKDLAQAMANQQSSSEKQAKDLAEQFKFGQGELAKASLDKMIKDLKDGKISASDLARMNQELKKALDPAKPYGGVSSKLDKALQKLGKGDNKESSAALQEASDELKKLLDQMDDSQALMASLEALKKAEQALASGKSFGTGECKNPGGVPGDKSGRGVGTWTDENSWIYPKQTPLEDNSLVNRPDRDPKANLDNGDGQLADNLAPTKIKGKFSPGASMPSVTLKGVSIKGTSSVSYKEAAAAAQSDAQSALNHDQVPRAYQASVKDYFDDMKK
ncbi:MAG: hypothetical protein JWN25_1576 [Verrucomicrobiales bacterium]|nr:hypothetical protein [Verrucomicrobiales bacterium]